MKVKVARNAGMCFGVKRALDMAEDAAREAKASGRKAYVIGQLAHNAQVSRYLADIGVSEIDDLDPRVYKSEENVFIFPSHGKGPLIYDIVNSENLEVVDTVCPCVRQALDQALTAAREGYFVLIFGDREHDEVAGYAQWLSDSCLIVKDYLSELAAAKLPPKVALMAQTTTDYKSFTCFIDWLREGGREPLVINSICEATRLRREAAEELALEVDLMLVIGGTNSANTKNLFNYCAKLAPDTKLIQTADDIDLKWLHGVKSIGITAGASTPDWVIKEVIVMTEEFKEQDQEMEQVAEREQDMEQEQAVVQEQAVDNESGDQTIVSLDESEPAAQDVLSEPAGDADITGDDDLIVTDSSLMPSEEASGETEREDSAELKVPDSDIEPQEADSDSEANFSQLEAEMGYLEFNPGDLIKGTIVKVSSDEVLVDIGYKSEGIIPSFELAFTKIDPLAAFSVGDPISVEVVKEDRDGNIILSRKNAIFEERIALLEERFKNGEPVEAKVIDVVKGGLLVDVGMRGFVPASHVERGFARDLNDYLHKTFNFKILELNRAGKRVILSRKEYLEDELKRTRQSFWEGIEEGQTRKGTVRRITDFGAFVDIGGCDGLLHVSEMGWGKVGRPSDVVSVNDSIEVFVLKVDKEKEKVSLSLKKMIPNPWDFASEKYQVGSVYQGKVVRAASFGAFIQLEPSLEGLAHISQLANFRVEKVEDVLIEGMEVPVQVLSVDLEKKRVSLSVKAAIDLPRLNKPEQAAADTVAPAPVIEEEIDAEAFNASANESSAEDGASALGDALSAALASRMSEVAEVEVAESSEPEAKVEAEAKVETEAPAEADATDETAAATDAGEDSDD